MSRSTKEKLYFKNGEAVYGDTPLLKATKIQQLVITEDNIDIKALIIKLLLKNGADRTLTDTAKKTSVNIAKENFEKAKEAKRNYKIKHMMTSLQRPSSENVDNEYKSASFVYDMLKNDFFSNGQ